MKNGKQQFNFILVAVMLLFISCNNDGANRTGTDTTMTGNVRETRQEDFVTDVLDMNAEEIAWLNAGINKGMDSELKSQAKKNAG